MQYTEAVVAKVNDLQDGEKKQVSVGKTDVLLIRVDQTFHAIGAHCTHYKAPLVKGVLSQDCIVCPWHNAYFNITTGDQQQPPGLDSLPRYQVRVEGEDVIISVPENASEKRNPVMAEYDSNVDSRTFVILGAGAAGIHAAETLRTVGYQGRILMVTREQQLPYDRTWLSKDYFTGKVSTEELPLRPSEFYKDHNIEVLLNKQVVRLDAKTKTISFADGDNLTYDMLLLATGGKPSLLDVPGADLANVFTLRSFTDCDRLLAATQQAKSAVVVGSSFIGMEVAAGLTKKDIKVTVVSTDTVPFKKILGEEIGRLFQQVHEENGVSFQFGRKVAQLKGSSKVEAVILDNGHRIEADMVVVGIGVQPATDFMEGISLDAKDKSVCVDEYLKASDGVYAAGDIARFPDSRTGEAVRIEHWRIAAGQGRIAAYNMVGQPTKFTDVPVFWTMQFNFPLRYVGHAEDWDEVIVDGDLQKREFIAFYIKDQQVLAAASSKRDTETAAIVELMRLNQIPSETLRQGKFDFIKQLQEAQS